MKTNLIYLDTSVIGGCYDREFALWSNALLDDIRNGVFKGVTSEVVYAEISDAPEFVRQKYSEFLESEPINLELGDEALALMDCYCSHGILSEKFANDMLHIALASTAGIDMLVSWNFKHIVRYDKIRLFNAVNLEQGYRHIDIYSPREVTDCEKD